MTEQGSDMILFQPVPDSGCPGAAPGQALAIPAECEDGNLLGSNHFFTARLKCGWLQKVDRLLFPGNGQQGTSRHPGRCRALYRPGRQLDQPAFQALLALMRNEKFWVKVSGADRITRAGPPYADAVPFARKLVAEFPDRVVWGSDWPHPHHKGPVPDDGELVDLIAEIAPTPALRQALMVDNPQRLYRFAAPP